MKRSRKFVRRLKNGKPADAPRPERAEEARRTATEARQRIYLLSERLSATQEAGSAVGRLRLTGELSEEQYFAANTFEQIAHDYSRAILIRPVPSAGDFNRTQGFDGHDGSDARYVERCQVAIQSYRESRRALFEASDAAYHAVWAWVCYDQAIQRLVGDLRLGLNALARLYADWGSPRLRA